MIRTEFGTDDIDFWGADERVLFFTTTHEGHVSVVPEVLGK